MSVVGNNSGESFRNKVQSVSCKSVEESQNNYGKWAETYEKVTETSVSNSLGMINSLLFQHGVMNTDTWGSDPVPS